MKLTDVHSPPAHPPRRRRCCAKTAGTIVFEVATGANQGRGQARDIEQLARRPRSKSVRTSISHGKIKRQGRFAGPPLGLEEGLRQACAKARRCLNSWKGA